MKNRMINTRFWSDTFIAGIDPLEKLLFLYFISNQYTNICGIYEIPIKQIALDTGIDRDNIEKVFLPRLAAAGKIYYIDGWVWIKNFTKYQKMSGNILLGIKNAEESVPSKIMAKIKEIKGRGVSDPTLTTSGGELTSKLNLTKLNLNCKGALPLDTTRGNAKHFIRPSLEEVKNYFILKESNEVEAERFWNYNEARNWMMGKNRIVRWSSAANNWINGNKDSNKTLKLA